MVDFFFIHDFILVILCDLEMSILIVSSPIRCLYFTNPLVWSGCKPRRLDFILAFSEPMIDVGEIVRLKSSIHSLDTVPGHIATGCEWFASVHFHDVAVYSPCMLWCQKDDSAGYLFNCCDPLQRDVRGRSFFEILILFFTHTCVSVQIGVDCGWGDRIHTDAQGG